MTQKELLYLEDAINHEISIINILHDTIKNMKDKKLKDFLKKEESNHSITKERLLSVLKEKSHE